MTTETSKGQKETDAATSTTGEGDSYFLPAAIVILAAGAVVIAAILLSRRQGGIFDEEAEVENFDVVKNSPYFARPAEV
ncbi:MAG: hypothetical protein M3Q97_02665 [Bacteroidota bacterium]|nr:hypothetical protein [Bacteroidota bacterium]